MNQPLDISFFGRHCRFSALVLASLIEAGHRINLVIVPHDRGSGVHIVQRPSIGPRLTLTPVSGDPSVLPTVAGLAWEAGAMLVESSRNQLESLPHRFERLRKGVLIAACYPWRLPETTLQSPPLGALNLHPSLLPAHRGPDPIFWTLHAGDKRTGATIHRMTGELDAGPIVAQRSFDIPLRTHYQELEDRTVRLGARLLLEALSRLPASAGEPLTELPPLESMPAAGDLVIEDTWSAERAFRFAFGAGPVFGPLTVRLGNSRTIAVTGATDLHPGQALGEKWAIRGDRPSIQFTDGVVQFSIAESTAIEETPKAARETQ